MNTSFPLSTSPLCPTCDGVASRAIVLGHKKGNYGRPYYYCQFGHDSVFITWDDDRDISAQNPQCWCKRACRRNQRKTRQPQTRQPEAWYACASGACLFRAQIKIGPHAAELEAAPPSPERPCLEAPSTSSILHQ